jgi:Protein of unknown function (DUF2934)
MQNSSLPDSPSPVLADLQEAIRRRAEEIYFESGRIPGRDLENWSQAEQDIMRQVAESSPRRKAVVVRVNGVQYVGEYQAESCDGYVPGEFRSGASVPVRFEGEKMFLRRPNGRDLETTIVRKI